MSVKLPAGLRNMAQRLDSTEQRINKFEKELQTLRMTAYEPIPADEIIKMTEYLSTRATDHEKQQIIKGIWNSCNYDQVDDEVALESIKILDNQKNDDKYYLDLRPHKQLFTNNETTIGSLMFHAKQHGYDTMKIKSAPANVDIETETITVEKYLEKEHVIKMIEESTHRILVDSPTGSGKTRATIEALKEISSTYPELRIFFSVPSTLLAKQTASDFELGRPLLGSEVASKLMEDNYKRHNTRVTVGTYDKAPYFMESSGDKPVIIITDEAHKEVGDYSHSFRAKAINGIFNLKYDTRVIKFISLSGTPQEIDLNTYDKKYIIKQTASDPLFKEAHVLKYHHTKEYATNMAKLIIHEIDNGVKPLVLVNSGNQIEIIAGALKRKGYKTSVLTSKKVDKLKGKELNQYNRLVKEQKYPDGIDVLITTILIADGINILNDDGRKHSVIIAPVWGKSPMFNLPTIKQYSHRFRFTYERLIVPVFFKDPIEKKRLEQTELYNIESSYRWNLWNAMKTQQYNKNHFATTPTEYKPSLLERGANIATINPYLSGAKEFDFNRAFQEQSKRTNGMDHDTQLVNDLESIISRLFEIDRRGVRKTASKAQESYYSYYPNAFINALENLFDTQFKQDTLDGYLIEQSGLLHKEMTKLTFDIWEAQSENENKKRNYVQKVIPEKLYYTMKERYAHEGRNFLQETNVVVKSDDEEITWKDLKEAMHKIDYAELRNVLPICSYEQGLQVMKNATSPSKINSFTKTLDNIHTLEIYRQTESSTVTATVLKLLNQKLSEVNDRVGADNKLNAVERAELLHEVYRETKSTLKEVKEIYELYFVSNESSRKIEVDGKKKTEKVRHSFRLINIDDLAKEQEFESSELHEIYETFTYLNYKELKAV